MKALFSKILAFFMSILAMLGLVKSVDHPEPIVVEDQYAYYISEDRTEIEFSLDSNPSTGYGWECEVEGNAVTLDSQEYVSDPSEGMVGVGGTQYYSFVAAEAGEAAITFTYSRSWERSEYDITIQADITVDEALRITVTNVSELLEA